MVNLKLFFLKSLFILFENNDCLFNQTEITYSAFFCRFIEHAKTPAPGINILN